MSFTVRTADLAALNSMTKYPSIPTYHVLDPRNGNLTEDTVEFTGPVIGTEKIDGTNARIILLPDGTYLLGSREDLLYARGDLIGNPAQGIVAALKPIAEPLEPVRPGAIQVFYLEVYGGKVGKAARSYTGHRAVGARLFDSMVIDNYELVSSWAPEQISGWRDSGGQPYLDEDRLRADATMYGLELAPRLFTIDAAGLPREVDAMREFLAEQLPRTLVELDADAIGKPEGVVLRTPARTVIAKARFDDYDRTIRRRTTAERG